MSAFLYGSQLQWRLDIRNKGIFVTYYIIPLAFFLFMGGVFTSIMPDAYKTIIQSMTVFGVTMGAIIAAPMPLCELYGSDIKKAYKVGGIPLWTIAVGNFISAFVHLSIVSLFIFLIAPIVFKAELPANLFVYFVSFVLMLAANICIGTLFGLFVKSASKITMVSQFVFLPSIMLSGIMFPVEMLPKAFEYIGKLLPATWGYKLMCSETLSLGATAPLLIIIALSVVLAAIKLRKMEKQE